MTPQQAKVFAFVRDEIAASGISPTYEEIGRFLGLTTKSGVHRIVDRLILDGKLVKAKDRLISARHGIEADHSA